MDIISDLLLGIGIIFLSFRCIHKSSLLISIILYMCMGLLVTLTWGRLGAVDVAIAEAGIGAGLTGALLLATWHKLKNFS